MGVFRPPTSAEGIQQSRSFGEIGIRIGADDARNAGRIARIGRKYHRSRVAPGELRKVTRLDEKGNIRRAGRFSVTLWLIRVAALPSSSPPNRFTNIAEAGT